MRDRCEHGTTDVIRSFVDERMCSICMAEELAQQDWKIQDQQATIDKLRAALKKYGGHEEDCDIATVEAFKCSCGLDAALREAGESNNA